LVKETQLLKTRWHLKGYFCFYSSLSSSVELLLHVSNWPYEKLFLFLFLLLLSIFCIMTKVLLVHLTELLTLVVLGCFICLRCSFQDFKGESGDWCTSWNPQ